MKDRAGLSPYRATEGHSSRESKAMQVDSGAGRAL